MADPSGRPADIPYHGILCYLVTVSAYQNYNMATHRYFQIGEQLLDRVEISVKELEQATFSRPSYMPRIMTPICAVR